jgi:uncharacterized protein (DUF433 family)
MPSSRPRLHQGYAPITVAVRLDDLAARPSADEIVASYPSLGVDDVRAATVYAADLARQRIVEIGEPGAV